MTALKLFCTEVNTTQVSCLALDLEDNDIKS